jgi:hypothetical protein
MTSGREQPQVEAEPEAVELVLFQVAECYVYLVTRAFFCPRVLSQSCDGKFIEHLPCMSVLPIA